MPPLDPTLALTVVGAIASLAGLAVGLWQWFRSRGRGQGVRSEALERAQEAHWEELCELASGIRQNVRMPDTPSGYYVPYWGATSVPPESWSDVLVPFDVFEVLSPLIRDLDAHLGEHSFGANRERLRKSVESYWEAKSQGQPSDGLREEAWQSAVRLCDDLEPTLVRRRVIGGNCERCPMTKADMAKTEEPIARLKGQP